MKFSQIIFLSFGLPALVLLFAFGSWNTGAILTSAPWTSIETWDDFDADGTFVLDTLQCHNDNHWLFLNNGNLLITEGLIKCEPEMTFLDTILGQWTLENNDTRLKISFSGGEDGFSMNIYAVGPNEVTFRFSGSENPNDPLVRQRVILRR